MCAQVASGRTLAALAEDVSEVMGEECSRGMLSTWLNGSPDRKQALAQARETAADALADEALDTARSTVESNSRANALRIKALQWQASKLNRSVYGDTPTVAVGLSIGDLHLDALRQVNAAPDIHALPPQVQPLAPQVTDNKGVGVGSQTRSEGGEAE